jgi:DNA glycosylase AlkZ-like
MAAGAPLALTREQILGFRRRAGALDRRLPPGPESLRRAAWAGLQDSMPRSALLQIHARVDHTPPTALDDPSLAQVWGPRHHVYVIPAMDVAPFTLGRWPDDEKGRLRAQDLADRLHVHLAGGVMTDAEAGEGMRLGNSNSLRYASATGRVLIRWAGARAPRIWTVDAPDVDPAQARLDLARRHLHVFGPTTPAAFAEWAGIPAAGGRAAFGSLDSELTAVATPIGDGWILAADEAGFRTQPGAPAAARLLPSGDAYTLLQGADRTLLVPDASRRSRLWTSRVWPGAVLLDGEIRGTWRRANRTLVVEPWGRLSRAQRDAVEAEAAGLPLPGVAGTIVVRWQ